MYQNLKKNETFNFCYDTDQAFVFDIELAFERPELSKMPNYGDSFQDILKYILYMGTHDISVPCHLCKLLMPPSNT